MSSSGEAPASDGGDKGTYARQGINQSASGFRLPPGINYGASLAANLLKIPHPCIPVDWLTYSG
ncbi:hypothetical protein ES703_70399 [subsurface metagenome]